MTDLAARYGRTPERRRRDRMIAIGVAAFIVVVMLAWVVWGGIADPSGSVEAQDIRNEIVDDSSATVDFTVTVEPGTPVRCAVQVVDTLRSTVGWVEVDLDGADVWTTEHSVLVRTSAPGFNGLVYRCWLR